MQERKGSLYLIQETPSTTLLQDQLSLVDKLSEKRVLNKKEFSTLLTTPKEDLREYLYSCARAVRKQIYGNEIYMRGLIEFTNYCKNDCYYCGIRRSNLKASRYRLSEADILSACDNGYSLGFRTFVLQGGEDSYYTDAFYCNLIRTIKNTYPDCAITLSIGERSYDSYLSYYLAGADRYLLRHETASYSHYQKLHPANLSLSNRKQCLSWLKEIGYQVGSGFMVGSPYQTKEDLIEDLLFLHELNPHMIGIGPFISHHDTPFAKEASGTLEDTLFFIAILRLMFPYALITATTALGTIHPKGREQGILAGANVVMPNLSPKEVRSKYLLYDNKICTGDEAAECRSCMERRMNQIGYQIEVSRGDYKGGINHRNSKRKTERRL